MKKFSDETHTKRKWSPNVMAVEIDEELNSLNLVVLKMLIQKAALRKLKEHDKDRD